MISDCSPTSAMPSGIACFGHCSSRGPPVKKLHGPGEISGGSSQSALGGVIVSSISAPCTAKASNASGKESGAQSCIRGFIRSFGPSELSLPRCLQDQVLQDVDVALQVRARGIAADDVAQQL